MEMDHGAVSAQRGVGHLDEMPDDLLRAKRRKTLIEYVLGESECGLVVPLALLHEVWLLPPWQRQGPALQRPNPQRKKQTKRIERPIWQKGQTGKRKTATERGDC